MYKLETVQTQQKLNEVYTYDSPGPGGANHAYAVYDKASLEMYGDACAIAIIKFQKGARNEDGSIRGVIDADLLEMVKHRLEAFQAGPFASEYNEMALFHITMALEALNQRVEDRIARDVLGKEEK